MATETPNPPRLPTSKEVGALVRLFRDMRHWSQEQLAAVSGLSTRTIQRVEQGQAADFDTHRALARAFDMEDIDTLNKPHQIPTVEELMAAKEQFGRDNITVPVTLVTSGRELAQAVESCDMDHSEPGFELPREAAVLFAELIDSLREYRDCADLHTQVQKLDVYDEFQRQVDKLKALGVCLCQGRRKMRVKLNADTPDDRATTMTALCLIAYPAGKAPEVVAMPKAAQIRL